MTIAKWAIFIKLPFQHCGASTAKSAQGWSGIITPIPPAPQPFHIASPNNFISSSKLLSRQRRITTWLSSLLYQFTSSPGLRVHVAVSRRFLLAVLDVSCWQYWTFLASSI